MARTVFLALAAASSLVAAGPAPGQSSVIENCFHYPPSTPSSQTEYCVRRQRTIGIPPTQNHPLGQREVYVDVEVPTEFAAGERLHIRTTQTNGLHPVNLWNLAMRKAGWLEFGRPTRSSDPEPAGSNLSGLVTYVHEQDRSTLTVFFRNFSRGQASPHGGALSYVEAYIVSFHSGGAQKLPLTLDLRTEQDDL